MLDRVINRSSAGQSTATRYNPKMYRVAVVALLVVFAGLQYRLWIGEGSFAQVHHLQSMRDELQKTNAKAEKRNDAMQAQIEDLKSGVGATEGRARVEMGMVKPGETFFLTVPDKQADGPSAAPKDAAGSQG